MMKNIYILRFLLQLGIQNLVPLCLNQVLLYLFLYFSWSSLSHHFNLLTVCSSTFSFEYFIFLSCIRGLWLINFHSSSPILVMQLNSFFIKLHMISMVMMVFLVRRAFQAASVLLQDTALPFAQLKSCMIFH